MPARERLPWSKHNPPWRDNVDDNQHVLGGLSDRDARAFLHAKPIEDADLRQSMLDGAREFLVRRADHPLMFDLQVALWRSLTQRGANTHAVSFRDKAGDFAARHRGLIARVLRDYDRALSTTLRRLACTRRFDRLRFEHIVKTFHTGLAFDAFDAKINASFVTHHADGYLTMHGIVVEASREKPDEKTRKAPLKALFKHFAAWVRSSGGGSCAEQTRIPAAE